MGEETRKFPQEKLAVYAAVESACEDVGTNNTFLGRFSVDQDATLLLSELFYRKLEEASQDLEAFACHGKRTNINLDDVKLLFRKNPKIIESLKAMEESEEKEKPTAKRKAKEAEIDS
ncbi:Hypothetical protein NTJ_00363 [Nesidiocoris tenuis]|uniref:Centromere protein S n=1 Tax=Nesidiocoris tenuis TaxID=355587 RepID=A0ABN7A6K5_9HEMI|nr:Hypothetical protein NTJ_00363 [Nesidiocoris tenuis]